MSLVAQLPVHIVNMTIFKRLDAWKRSCPFCSVLLQRQGSPGGPCSRQWLKRVAIVAGMLSSSTQATEELTVCLKYVGYRRPPRLCIHVREKVRSSIGCPACASRERLPEELLPVRRAFIAGQNSLQHSLFSFLNTSHKGFSHVPEQLVPTGRYCTAYCIG
jgi:hypothetical protein